VKVNIVFAVSLMTLVVLCVLSAPSLNPDQDKLLHMMPK